MSERKDKSTYTDCCGEIADCRPMRIEGQLPLRISDQLRTEDLLRSEDKLVRTSAVKKKFRCSQCLCVSVANAWIRPRDAIRGEARDLES